MIDGLGLKDITLVQDWGGPIGLSCAVTHPENVARLIIMNTWAWPVNRDWYYIAFSGFMGGPIGRLLIRRYNFFARSVMRQAFGDKRKLTPAAHEQYPHALPTAEDRKGCYVLWLGSLGFWESMVTVWVEPHNCAKEQKTVVIQLPFSKKSKTDLYP